MEFVIDLLAFVLSSLLMCVLVVAVVFTASLIYVCVNSARAAAKKDRKDG